MSFPRYPEYRDSGVAWLGEVPAHWDLVSLKRVAKIQYGIGEPPKYLEAGTPLIRATNVNAGKITENGLVFVDPEDIPENRIVWLSPGDIVVVRSGAYTGDSAIILEEHCPCIAGFDMVMHPTGCNSVFLQYVFLSKYLKDHQIDLEKLRAAQPHLNAEELGHCFVLLPSSQEQSAITAFLDRETARIDALVVEQERLIELLKEKRQAVISHAVTKGLNPDAPTKGSGIEWLGEFPAHWNLKRIKHLIHSIEQGWSPQCESFPVDSDEQWGVLKVGCVNNGRFRPEENKSLPLDLDPIPSLGIFSGDLLISRANTRDLVGSAAVSLADFPKLMLCDKLYRIRVNARWCLPAFLVDYLGTGKARGQIEVSATGASDSMVNIGQATILELAVAVPPIPEQIEILAYLKQTTARLDDLVAEAQHAIDLLKERRAALISAAVTGRIDVRGLVADNHAPAERVPA